MAGGEGFEAVARYVEEKAREYGLEDVRAIRQKTATPSWSPKVGELTLVSPYVRRLAFTPEVALSLADSVQGSLDNRGKVERPRALHPLMAYEVLNFVDGRRTYADICRAVAAQADAAGSWYYGVVTSDDVFAYLDSAEKAGILRVVAQWTIAKRRDAPPPGGCRGSRPRRLFELSVAAPSRW